MSDVKYELLIRKDVSEDGTTTLSFFSKLLDGKDHMPMGTIVGTHEEARDIVGAIRFGRPANMTLRVLRGADVESLSETFTPKHGQREGS
jgi:hypothetical protein